MARRDEDSSLPTWFWFFLAFPLSLIVVLLWQRRKLALPRVSFPVVSRPRYSEPDSIPIDLRPEPEELPPAEEAEAVQAEPANLDAVEADDLKVIEGIGPAISRLMQENSINTYRQLADTPVEQLEEILRKANLRRLANPATWPEQASFAAAGDWDGMKQFQETLKGGRRV